MTNWNAIANSLAEEGLRQLREHRRQREAEDRARPVGTEAITLGLTDYRLKPERSIHAEDWAVWLVRWNGKGWVRTKRLASRKSLSEAFDAIKRHCTDRELPRVEAMHAKGA